MNESTPAAPSAKSAVALLAGTLAGAVIMLVLVGAAAWLSTGMGLLHLARAFRDGRVVINADQPAVVHQIQQLQRLETVSYTMDKIISGERDNPYLPKFLVSDRLLLVVHGEVIAGVDLTKLQVADVSVKGRSVSIRLPKAEILVTRLDNTKTRVYSRDTGLFSSPDPNLESQVRQEAERQIQQAALQDGILKSADENARTAIATIVKGLGFDHVEFQ